MVFSSPTFLLFYLPLVLLFFYLVPSKYKNIVLSIASIYFYAFGEKYLVLLILLSTIINYYCGILIENGRKKLGLNISLIYNLSTLVFFKYFNFALENYNSVLKSFDIAPASFDFLPEIVLPIGISFYTFECLSYVVDVYRGEVKANKSLLEFLTFVTLFPHLVAGPVIRYVDLQRQIQTKDLSINQFSMGMERFILGLCKKMIIANTFAVIADKVFSYDVNSLSTSMVWLGILSYSIQIYFDFSGYSDMAIGLGKMFGFNFLENFNYPYISKSIKDFWRRWHISLSTWFRDYVYIPLGGNKKGNVRTYVNLFIVFFVTGLWHGASWNYIFWGLFHGSFLILERFGFDKILKKIWTPFQHFYTVFVVLIGWVFFRANTMQYAFEYISRMFFYNKGNETITTMIQYFYINNEFYFILFLAILFSMPFYKKMDNFIFQRKLIYLRPLFFITLLFVAITYIAASSYNPFIYFKF